MVEKCTFCTERLAVGQKPLCVEACEGIGCGALTFGDLGDPASPVSALLRDHDVARRKPELGHVPARLLPALRVTMLEKALTGSRRWWTLLAVLAAVAAAGFATYLHQLSVGLGITGLSRDVPWGLYIAQLTFLVGVAASAVMVVLPYYLHHYKAFGKLAILGEFLAISAVVMCLLFVFVDIGQPRADHERPAVPEPAARSCSGTSSS